MKTIQNLSEGFTIIVDEDEDHGIIAVYTSTGEYVTVGELSYVILDKQIKINNIEVLQEYRCNGIGELLINVLEINHIDKVIDWGVTTELGMYLQSKFD